MTQMMTFSSLAFNEFLPINDPYINNVVSYLPGTGTNGSSTFTDYISSTTWAPTGAFARITTAQQLFGSGSLFVSGTGAIVNNTLGTTLGSSAFTIDCWYYSGSSGAQSSIYTVSSGPQLGLYMNGTSSGFGTIQLYGGSSLLLTTTEQIAKNTWNYLLLQRSGGLLYLYVNGALQYINPVFNVNLSGLQFVLLNQHNLSEASLGYMQMFRVTNVVRYSSFPYTIPVPTDPFPIPA